VRKPSSILLGALVAFALVANVSQATEPQAANGAHSAAERPEQPDSTGAPRGVVEVDGQWLTIDEACRYFAGDKALQNYARLRDSARWKVDDQLRLARWCAEQGMADSAQFHYRILLQLDSRNREARNALGLKEFHGLLLTEEEIAQVKTEATARKDAIESWRSTLRNLRRKFQSRTPGQREAAERELLAIDNASVLPSVEAALMRLNNEAAVAGVRLAAKFQSQAATDMLARQAISNPFPEARREVTKALKARSYFAWVPTLLSLMESPVEVHARLSHDVSPSFALTLFRRGPFGDELVGFNEQTVVRGVQTNVNIERIRVNSQDQMWEGNKYLGETGIQVPVDPTAAARRAALTAHAVAAAEQHNQRVTFLNQRIAETLSEVTSRPADTDLASWYRWWYDYNDYDYPEEVPLYTDIGNYSQYATATNTVTMGQSYMPPPAHSCFLAGTLVTTKTGLRPIEQIRIGDFVLAQDVETGELKFKPVAAVTFGPVTMMMKLRLDGATLYPTPGHPFWVVGEGWKMARELKPGDQLYTLRGSISVESIDEWGGATTHNLIVADYNDYFVGEQQILAHDITIRRPSLNAEPGVPKPVLARAQ
jgi:hypothetical protein